jgi:hypothetical protein
VAAGTVEEQIRSLVTAHRPELQQLVDQALEAELEALVAERVAARNGGNGFAHQIGEQRAGLPAAKLCHRCKLEKPATEFERGRNTCRQCRREQQRARENPPADLEPPRTAEAGDPA